MQPSFVKWIKKFRFKNLSRPFIFESFLYIIADKVNLYKLNIHSGDIIWHLKLKNKATSCAGIYKEHLYCITNDGVILKINKTYGKLTSSHSTDMEPAVFPLQEKNVIYIPCKNDRLVAYDMQDMRVLFSTETEHDMISPPVIGKDKVYILGRTKLYAISKVTGNIEWIRRFNIRWISDCTPVPKLYKGRVFLQMRGFDIKTGLGNWIVYGRGLMLTDTYIAGEHIYYGGKLINPKRGKKGFIQIIDIEKKERKAFIYLDEIPNEGLKVYGKTIIFISKAGYFVSYAGN
jgi:outer membrane protein assembly factor BamB